MGPSGSGKTTLLSILGCMLAPSGGTVRVCGTSTSGARPDELAKIRRQHIGFVFQAYHLFSTLTAAEKRLVTIAGRCRTPRLPPTSAINCIAEHDQSASAACRACKKRRTAPSRSSPMAIS